MSLAEEHQQILQCFESQLTELDLLQSMYPSPREFAIDDCTAVDELRRLVAECEAANCEAALARLASCGCRIGFTFSAHLLLNTSSMKQSDSSTMGASSGTTPVLECICRLPATYPVVKPPGVFLRSDLLNRDQLRFAADSLSAELEANFTPGQPVLYQLLNWLAQFAETSSEILPGQRQDPTNSGTAGSSTVPTASGSVRLCRLWIHSHHIYNSLKRRDILNWSSELGLTGFSIVGKPGLVCAEGGESALDEFWQRLRRLNWKKLTLKEKDFCPAGVTPNRFRKFSDFRELGFDAKPGKGRDIQQDWGLVIRFLEDKGLSHVIPLYFGNIR